MNGTAVTLRVKLALASMSWRAASGRARSELAEEAGAKFLARAWARERIEEGLRQADAGEFASGEEVARVLGKYRARI